jgi:PAS domain S-box-containing protein
MNGYGWAGRERDGVRRTTLAAGVPLDGPLARQPRIQVSAPATKRDPPNPPGPMASSSVPPFFPQAGEMARLLNAFDWSDTELGPPNSWPPCFRAQVQMSLDSRIPMMLGWGPEFRLVYNDGYIPIMGEKHPAIWQAGAHAFEELWHLVGPILEGVYRSGEPVMMENALLPLVRRGFLEACYFTFSYSPLRNTEGQVIGLLSTAVDTTREVLASRRERLLGQIARPVPPSTPRDAVARAAEPLSGTDDLPCHLVLLRGGEEWQVASSHGVDTEVLEGWASDPASLGAWVSSLTGGAKSGADHSVEPLRLGEIPAPHPFREGAPLSGVVVLPFEGEGNGPAPSGPEGTAGEAAPDGLILLGTHAMLPWDDSYASFSRRLCGLLAGHFDAQRLRALTLAEAEDRYHQLFMQALDGIILGRPSGEILAANPAACRILGYTEEELVAGGRPLVQDPEDPRWTEGLTLRSDTGAFSGEISLLHKDGHRVPCEVTSRIFTAPTGERRSTVVLRDVSQRLLLESQLAEAQKLEVVGRVAGGLAHDFNNLLAVIDLQADLLAEELKGRPGPLADLELLNQTSRRAAALIRRLLDFTRRSQGEPRAFNPALAISEMAPLLRRLVGSGCELEFHLADGVPEVHMPPHQFEQVVMNLVVNARDAVEATGRSGVITVRVDPGTDPGGVRIRVIDDGVGMPEEVREQVFDPFYTTKTHGSGIGLHTVRLLAEGMGGAVAVRTAPGKGSIFTVSLPAWDSDGAPAPAEPTPPRTGRLDGLRVLLVEDQAQLRGALTRALARAGAEVVPAANGDEGLRLARSGGFPVVVTDVVMPLLTGPELVRILREEQPGVGVVFMSGYAGDDSLSPELLEGARFLAKPFAPAVLVEAILEVVPLP